MRLLLDTHVFLWLNNEPEKLSSVASQLCEDTINTLYLSPVSPWEIQIKKQLGKLELPLPLPKLIDTQQKLNGLQILPIELSHIYELEKLPHYHNDPFDRLLIAQTKAEAMTLISADSKVKEYPVEVIW